MYGAIIGDIVGSIYYDEMTWPEVKEAAKTNRVASIPVGSIEDHGKHLPVMTDNLIITPLCSEVGQIPEDVVVLPNAPYGFEAHHMNFPGSIDVHWHTSSSGFVLGKAAGELPGKGWEGSGFGNCHLVRVQKSENHENCPGKPEPVILMGFGG